MKILSLFLVSTPLGMTIALEILVWQGPHLGWKGKLKYIIDKKEKDGREPHSLMVFLEAHHLHTHYCFSRGFS